MQVIGESFHHTISGIVFSSDIGKLEYVVDEKASSIMIWDIDVFGFVVVDRILRKINTGLIITV